jgi:hypothetical protein
VHDAVEVLVDRMVAISRELAQFSPIYNRSLPRLRPAEPTPPADLVAFVKVLPASEQWSVARHVYFGNLTLHAPPDLEIDEFLCERITKGGDSLTFHQRGRTETKLTLIGERKLVSVLNTVLQPQRGMRWREVRRTIVPRDVDVLEAEQRRIENRVADLRVQIYRTQWVIDLVVLDLYGIVNASARNIVLQHAYKNDGGPPP